MIAIGTKVVANDGFSTRVGQVADHFSNQWGSFHVVLIGDQFETVGHIDGEDQKGIGWKVATSAEIARAARYASR
jgi:hypothetical protein